MPPKSFKPTIPNSQGQVTSSKLSYSLHWVVMNSNYIIYIQCDQDLCGYLWSGLFNWGVQAGRRAHSRNDTEVSLSTITNFKVYNYYFLSHACKYSGSWKTKQFKSYNFNSLGMPPQAGHLHPLMKVRAEIRQIFLEMGLGIWLIFCINPLDW